MGGIENPVEFLVSFFPIYDSPCRLFLTWNKRKDLKQLGTTPTMPNNWDGCLIQYCTNQTAIYFGVVFFLHGLYAVEIKMVEEN